MVNKNITNSKYKLQNKKLIFYLLLFVYIIGMVTGCVFTFRNKDNIEFIKQVSLTEKLLANGETTVYIHTAKIFIRDAILLVSILMFKYSGILKSCCICVPFILSVQNACLYSVMINAGEISVFNLLFNYIAKDTAVSLLILMYCFIITNEIIHKRNNPQKDIKKLSIYFSGLSVIYILNILIKIITLPLQ